MMLLPEKEEVALMLERLNVDVIEAGFAAASRGEFNSVMAVARKVKRAAVSSLSRAVAADIDASSNALKEAVHGRIHIVLGVSDIHLKYKVNMSRAQALACVSKMVRYARNLCPDVQFTAEDAARTDEEFLVRLIDASVEAGADTVNLSDTVGFRLPDEFGGMIRRIRNRASGLAKAKLSVHVHDDLGMALASTISAINAGVDQVECTINGIGDRAGICALEELATVLQVRQDYFPEVRTDLDSRFFLEASQLVERVSGARMSPNKPVVGTGSRASLRLRGEPSSIPSLVTPS